MANLIHFQGAWDEDAQAVLEDAARVAEEALELPLLPPFAGKAWICSRQEQGQQTVYIASRAAVNRVLWAHNVRELAQQFHELRREGPSQERRRVGRLT